MYMRFQVKSMRDLDSTSTFDGIIEANRPTANVTFENDRPASNWTLMQFASFHFEGFLVVVAIIEVFILREQIVTKKKACPTTT